VCRPLDNGASETPGVRQRLGHAAALNAGLLLLPFNFVHQSITPLHISTVVDQRPRQHANWLRHRHVTTTSSCCRPPSRLGLIKGVDGVRRRLRCDQADRENAARLSRAPIKNGAAVRGSRLKIATDVAGVLGSSEAPVKTGRSFSLARMD
jgi:hypothetical protein